MNRCTWTSDGNAFISSCGTDAREYPGDLEVCPGCGALCEFVEPDALADDEFFADDDDVIDVANDRIYRAAESHDHIGSSARFPVNEEWSDAMEPLCKDHSWAALGGLQDWYRCQVCGVDKQMEFPSPTGRECTHKWQYGFEGEMRQCFSCSRNERLNRLIKDGEAGSGRTITWKVPA